VKYFIVQVIFIYSLMGCQSQPLEVATLSWQTLSANGEPNKRHEATFIEFKGKFYSLGGRKIQPVDIFDPNTNTWSHGAKPPFEIHHFQAVVYQDAIIIAGALTGKFPREKPVKNIIYYYPEQDKWQVKDELPTHRLRGGTGSVVYNDKLYLVAGIKNGHINGFVPWLDEFDLKTRQWKVLPNAPRARDHFQAGIADGKIYAIGGRTTSKATKEIFSLVIREIDQFDITKNSWETLDAKLDIGRAGTSTLVVGDQLWLLGGESNRPNPAHNEVTALDLNDLSLATSQPLVQGRHGTGAILYDNAVWTCCGAGTRGGRVELKTIEKINLPN
jgi:hypothetical protein